MALAILVYPVLTASRTAQLASRSALGDGRYFLREFDILRAEGTIHGSSCLPAASTQGGRY